MKLLPLVALGLLLLMPAAQPALASTAGAESSNLIKHVVVIVQENHTFDNYFGTFPGANGIQNDPPNVQPFHIVGPDVNMCHSTACAREAYDNGEMDGFLKAEGSNMTFGYFDQSDIPYYWSLAENYTLFDDYFTAAMGPSLPNHLYLVSAQDDGIADSITNQTSQLDIGSIAGELEAAHDSWAYYSPYDVGNENALGVVTSVADNSSMLDHIKDTGQFVVDLANGTMPDVSYLTAPDGLNEHPPYGVANGQAWVQGIISAIQASPYWNSTVILVTWDDYGGWYDHVAPPQVDRYGDGFRVPLLMVSPFAKQGYIDHTFSDHTSIMKFIERVFGLPPLTQRDASASDLFEALNVDYCAQAAMFADDALLVQGTPAPISVAATPLYVAGEFNPSISLAYMNIRNHPQDVVFHAVLRNASNQTLQVTTFTSRFPAGSVVGIPFYFQSEPPGNYSVKVIATSPKGVPLSQPLRLLLDNSIG